MKVIIKKGLRLLAIMFVMMLGILAVGTDVKAANRKPGRDNTYKITYDANGGTKVSLAGDMVKRGKQVDLNVSAQKEGYTFLGWNTRPDAEEGLSSFYMPAQDTVLYAIYSLPVSDVKEVYLKVWEANDSHNYRTYSLTKTKNGEGSYTYSLEKTNIRKDFDGKQVGWSLIACDYAGNSRVIKEMGPTIIVHMYIQRVEHYRYEPVSQKWVKFYETSDLIKEGEKYTPVYTAPPTGYRTDHIDEAYIVAGEKVSKAYYVPDVYTHTVFYDYKTNGGSAVETEQTQEESGKKVDLTVKAEKKNYLHIGWNTNPDAKEGLTSFTIGKNDVVLYAIYRKDVDVTYVDRDDEGTIIRKDTINLYNKEKSGRVTLPAQNSWTGWSSLGWSLSPKGNGIVEGKEGNEIEVCQNMVFYGRYAKNLTIEYDTNGSSEEIPKEEVERNYNASGEYSNPVITLPQAPKRPNYSFVSWETADEKEYPPKGRVTIEEETLFKAKWDEAPKLEANDRYFTLAQAQNGEITQEILLEKVKGVDVEDGLLENGKAVVIIDYSASDFTAFTQEGGVSVTYQATDSIGNQITKTVMIYIVDDTLLEDDNQTYARFISQRFYRHGEEYVPSYKGGLEESSIWRQNTEYKNTLNYALSNKKTNEMTTELRFLGKKYVVTKPGTGNWEHKVSTWIFTKEQVEENKKFLEENGFGTYRNKEGIKMFYEKFAHCKQ